MANTSTKASKLDSLEVRKEILIEAPIDIVFDSVLAELGAECEMPDGRSFPMKLEAWPGGRWYRDLGENAGHFWGHVQVIKPPKLIELTGPFMMSTAATNHLQYRLTALSDETTRVTLTHLAVGLILDEHRDSVNSGWQYWLDHLGQIAKRKTRLR